VREQQKSDPRFAFLDEEDPYHQYYRWRKAVAIEDEDEARRTGRPVNATPDGAATPAPPPQEEAVNPELVGYVPKSWDFKVDMPGVTAGDLDILRLTALFHARRGRAFLSALSVREGRNYQFDFLRPTHSLYGYYNRMVESYQKVIQPPAGMVDELVKADADPEIKWKTLEEARKRALWEASKRKRDDAKAKERDEEAKVFETIDWQDFVTVETIEFTQADMELSLPPPTSVDKLRVMSMAEKRMAAMIMEEPAAANAGEEDIIEEVDMEEDVDEDDEEARTQRIREERERERAREVQRTALEKKGVKIKKDYVAKGEFMGNDSALTLIRHSAWWPSGDGQVPQLWTDDCRERAVGAHPNRAARPAVEGAEAGPRAEEAAAVAAADWCQRILVSTQPCCGAYRPVRRRGGRGDAQGARGGGCQEAPRA
jgi:splicing factor 3A subunit 1